MRRTSDKSPRALHRVEILLHDDGGSEKPEIFRLAGDTQTRRKMP
jgi:hypothetical protein